MKKAFEKSKRDEIPRFWFKVYKEPGDNTCWLWEARIGTDGYGVFTIITAPETWKSVAAHRYAYTLLKGPIPPGMTLDHLCRVRSCVRPEHLEPVTNRENILRGISPFALRSKQTECHKGHPFTVGNTYYRKDYPGRQCRTCHRENAKRYWHKNSQ